MGWNRIVALVILVAAGCGARRAKPAPQPGSPPVEQQTSSKVDPPPAPDTPVAPAQIAPANALSLEGKWSVVVVDSESGNPDNVRQYGHLIRVSPTGELLETTRRELDNTGTKIEWREDPEVLGFARQVDNDRVQLKWRPEDAYFFSITSRSANGFTLVRHWTLKGPSPAEYSRMPHPRRPRGDRSFTVTMTFERRAKFP